MRLFLAILLLSSCQLATQMILPALPDIAASFALSDADAQQVIMLYFISFGLSQLFYGPWVDALGKRRIFFIGLSIFLLGSVLCYVAASVELLAIGRILQGIGAGCPFILSRVILSSSLSGSLLQKALASLAIAASVSAIAAPFLGGLLTTNFGWQSIFMLFIIHLLVSLAAGAYLLERDPPNKRRISVQSVVRDYAVLLGDSRFFTAALFKWLPTLMFLSLSTFLPFEMKRRFGMDAELYGSFMMVPVFGLLVGSTLARMLIRYFRSETIIILFWPLTLLAAMILLFYPAGIYATMLALTLFMVQSATYYGASVQLAMEPFNEKAGTASALLGSIDMFIFSVLAALVNRYWVKDLMDLGALFLLCSVIMALSWLLLKSKRKTARQSESLCQSRGTSA